MIHVKYIREYFEKDAAIHGETIKKVYRFVKKHPWLSIGAVGGTLGAASMISDVSKTILPTYHILNEEHKRGLTIDQIKLLKNIDNSLNKPNIVTKTNPYNILSTQPLA